MQSAFYSAGVFSADTLGGVVSDHILRRSGDQNAARRNVIVVASHRKQLMPSVPMNRARALIICTRPQDYAPTRLREGRYLLDRCDRGGGRRLAAEAIEWLRSKPDEPSPHGGGLSSPNRGRA